ncbi:ArsO family NAD(P)H-dependent flavin-containing monooxygenase [Chryseolinea lacunae]|uniref:NAD(P)/FAD-dependent oxidoreductase n=1 Tax=Chryseolinea lacunae TaxID=2801331 RepID=A0ABS1KYX7_9BACT|nr:ArsO family NAD(P)H-dependent flavin-containing monooxygenase [Chryseolinea lacunae]MBL0744660.1 NAD(P)/FAD-dependent oxidoreductase [Chryseolinea lacunae]
MEKYDVIVIGGGQSGLAMGYYLRRSALSYVILDNQTEAGGAWLHAWKSLRLFSPAQWSSLPGMIMTGGSDYYPTRDVAIEYLKSYETKYNLPVKRQVEVFNVLKVDDEFHLQTSQGLFISKVVVSATGSFNNPFVPDFKGIEIFKGQILHSSQYDSDGQFENKRVAIVGEGNSGAQILAEVSKVTGTLWVTQKEPRFLPDHIDGRFLFDAASQLYAAQKEGKPFKPPSLGDIVMVDSVKDARARKVFKSIRPFDHFTEDSIVWADGHEEKIDIVIFCTGFKPGLSHLKSLNMVNEDGKADTSGTKSTKVEGLWLVGYGNWTGFASATLIGVGRSAKKTVEEIVDYLAIKTKSVNA